MLSPPRRWTREQPLSSVTSCVLRVLCSRRHSIWTILILLMVCIAIQTFVIRQVRNDKPTEFLTLKFPVKQEQLFPALQKVKKSLRTEFALDLKQERTPPGGSDLDRGEKDYEKPSSDIKSKFLGSTVTPDKGSLTEAANVVAGNVLQATRENKLNPAFPDSLAVPNSRELLPADKNKPHLSSFSSGSTSVTSPIEIDPAKAKCEPKSHIVFLKTHKTASSTILNILYRYGDKRNLTFALPLKKQSQLFYPYFFASHFVEGVRSRTVKEFHIMCNHMRFQKSEVAKVMPADSFYFSILRNPVDMMESIFSYYKSIQAFQKTKSLDIFLNNSWHGYNPGIIGNHYARNLLAFDFGFDNNVNTDGEELEERVGKAVATIERDFHLVLISEYFDESMILLKRALCWSLEDVASFRLNGRSGNTRRSPSPDTAEKIKRWNALDWRIYLHFNITFWHKVDRLVGRERMNAEVSQLRELQSKLAKICLKDGEAVHPSQVKDAKLKPFQYGSAVIQGYNLNPSIDAQTKTKCERLITPELQYTDYLYTKQFPERAAKLRKAARMAASQRQRTERSGWMWTSRSKEERQRQIVRQKRITNARLTHTANTP